MPLKIKIKVLLIIFLWFGVCTLVFHLLSFLGINPILRTLIWVVPYTLIGLYFLYKIYPKFDIYHDVSFRGKQKLVALTFDDGPTKGFTDEILKILKDHSVTATFFVIGNKAKANKDILLKAISQNCELGAHTFNHTKLHNASYSEINGEITPTINILEELYSSSNKEFKKIFRAPHGFKNFALKIYLKKHSIRLIPWTRGVWDTDAPGSDWIEKMATYKPRKNEILLLHDGLGLKEVSKEQEDGVLKSLPKIIDFYKNNGYTFVKVSEFIKK
jgi:peptidoglycan-N-acetylglucosamine deacetylase